MAHKDIKEALWKNQGNIIKDSGNAYGKENSSTLPFYLLTLELKRKIQLFAGSLGRKLKEWIYVTWKETRLDKIKQRHITYISMLLNTAKIGIFWAITYICKPGAMYGRKNNFILTFLLEGCLVYQIYQVQYLQSHMAGFWGNKIIK